MACAITAGYTFDCREAVGGLRNIYVSKLASAVVVFDVNNIVTSITGVSFYKYALNTRFANSFTETFNASAENGTLFYTQELSTQFTTITSVNQVLFNTLSKARMLVVIETNNGELLLMGERNGALVNGGTASTGAAFGDFQGYTITLDAQQKTPAVALSSIAAITVI